MMSATLDHLDQLIAFNTVSSRPNTDLIDWVAAKLGARGARLIKTPDKTGKKSSLVASIGPDIPGGLMLSAHSDVVPTQGQDWTSDPFRLRREGDLAFGRGTTDMKGFLACCITAMEAVDAAGLLRRVHLALSYDEELGCAGTADLVSVLRARLPHPALAIVGEPTSMRVVSTHKGARVYETIFHGRAAHSSQSHLGVSANVHAAAFVTYLDAYFADLRRQTTGTDGLEPPHCTFNVGIMSGGQALNIIPDEARLVWEFRNIPEVDAARIEAAILHHIAATAEPRMQTTWEGSRIASRRLALVPSLDPHLNRCACALIRDRTGCDGDDAVSFGTEAGFFQEMGVPTIVCGPGSIDIAHKADEFIEIDQLSKAEKMLGDMIAWAAD
jgi:acetylornithine deacetylase